MFIDELKDYIVLKTSLVFGTDLFIGKLPDSKTSVIAMQKSTVNNQYDYGNRLGYSENEILFRVRGNQSEFDTRTLASKIEFLENLTNVTLTNYKIVRGAFETLPYQLDGTDNNNNYIYIAVYRAILERI